MSSALMCATVPRFQSDWFLSIDAEAEAGGSSEGNYNVLCAPDIKRASCETVLNHVANVSRGAPVRWAHEVTTLEAAGCSDWSSCTFEWEDPAALYYTGRSGDEFHTAIAVCHPCFWSGTLVKTGWDATFKSDCCKGVIAGNDPRCAPSWCPSDPQGECAAVLTAACSGTSSCGRHKFLTPLEGGADMDGAHCNTWYLATKLAAESGAYATASGGGTGGGLNALLSVTTEIGRYCGAEGAPSGECSCYNAVAACAATAGGCLIAADTAGGNEPLGGTRNVYRRVDAYCASAFSVSDGQGGWTHYDDVCSNNPTYGAPTLNGSGSANPYAPPGGVDPFPMHCWMPACQLQADDCIFKNLVDAHRACPPICLQYAAANSVVIDGGSVPTVHINVDALDCGTWSGVTSVSQCPYAWPTAQLAITMPVGGVTSFSLPLANTSQDTAAAYASLSTDWFSSLEPLVSLPRGPQLLANNAVHDVWITVDAGGLYAPQFYEGIIVAVDESGANPPATVPFDLDIVGATAPAIVDSGAGAPLHPPVVPSTRTASALSKGLSLSGRHITRLRGAHAQVHVSPAHRAERDALRARAAAAPRDYGATAADPVPAPTQPRPLWAAAWAAAVALVLLGAALGGAVWLARRRRHLPS